MNIEINNSGINDNFSLPIDGLSSCIQEIIQAYADGYQCERDFVVASVFAAVSTAIRKKYIQMMDGTKTICLSTFVLLPTAE